MFYEIIPTKLFRQDSGTLTYSSDTPLLPGQIVLIPLGKKIVPGITLKSVPKPNFPTKPIHKILYSTPLPGHLISALLWLSNYYLTPLPLVAQLLLPSGVEKTRRPLKSNPNPSPNPTLSSEPNPITPIPLPTLTPPQLTAITQLNQLESTTKLLHGVTGSGKTHLYLHLISNAFKNQTSVLLLVPEIGLTPQISQFFQRFFEKDLFLLHSKLTASARHQTWEAILQKSTPSLIIGPRSAIFSPAKNLGLIIIDEAHDSSYYQDNNPRYSTLRLASFLAQNSQTPHPTETPKDPHPTPDPQNPQNSHPPQNITTIFGTATPPVSEYHLAERKHARISLSQTALPTTPPTIQLLDLKSRSLFTKNRYFSTPLLTAITENLNHHHQTLIFHNRRGTAPLTLCQNCGWQALCTSCFLPLTLHHDHHKLLCHTCGYQTKVPPSCPSCGHPDLIHKGFGTKLLTLELEKLFPTAKIARFDTDTDKNHSLTKLYDQLKSGKIDLLVGTQSIAKGLDLPNLKTVAIVQADSGLNLPDYSAKERTFQLISQVIGRITRGHQTSTTVFIQTFQPNHPIIQYAIKQDYQSAAEYLLKDYRRLNLPPFAYLAQIKLTYKTEATTVKHIKNLHTSLQEDIKSANLNIFLSTPTPAFHEQSSSGYTWQLLLKSPKRAPLLSLLQKLPKTTHLQIALDPPSLI